KIATPVRVSSTPRISFFPTLAATPQRGYNVWKLLGKATLACLPYVAQHGRLDKTRGVVLKLPRELSNLVRVAVTPVPVPIPHDDDDDDLKEQRRKAPRATDGATRQPQRRGAQCPTLPSPSPPVSANIFTRSSMTRCARGRSRPPTRPPATSWACS